MDIDKLFKFADNLENLAEKILLEETAVKIANDLKDENVISKDQIYETIEVFKKADSEEAMKFASDLMISDHKKRANLNPVASESVSSDNNDEDDGDGIYYYDNQLLERAKQQQMEA